MNNYVKALTEGKIVYSESNEPRFYKLIENKIYYSDNLKTWNKSNSDINIFHASNWIIKG